jgi:hypothetical protein
MQLLLGRYLHWAHGNTLGAGPACRACRDGQLTNSIFKIYLKGDGRIAAVRYHNLNLIVIFDQSKFISDPRVQLLPICDDVII